MEHVPCTTEPIQQTMLKVRAIRCSENLLYLLNLWFLLLSNLSKDFSLRVTSLHIQIVRRTYCNWCAVQIAIGTALYFMHFFPPCFRHFRLEEEKNISGRMGLIIPISFLNHSTVEYYIKPRIKRIKRIFFCWCLNY